MVDEFEGKPCYRCGNRRFAVYTVLKESVFAGLTYEARGVCRSCGDVRGKVVDADERRAVSQLEHRMGAK